MRRSLVLVLPILAACQEPPLLQGGQTGEEVPVPCLEQATTLAWEEVPESVGRSPASWVGAWPEAGWETEIAWESGESGGLTLQVEVDDGSAALVERTPSTSEIDPSVCTDALQIDGVLTVTVGTWSDAVEVTLRSEGERGWASAAVSDAEAALVAAGEDPESWKEPLVALSTMLGPEETSGQLDGYGHTVEEGIWLSLGMWGATAR